MLLSVVLNTRLLLTKIISADADGRARRGGIASVLAALPHLPGPRPAMPAAPSRARAAFAAAGWVADLPESR